MRQTNSFKERQDFKKSKQISNLSSRLYGSIKTINVDGFNPNMRPSYPNQSYSFKTSNPIITRTVENFTKPVSTEEFLQITPTLEDPLSRLISKAKQITAGNQPKIEQAKRQLKQHNEKSATFLTGTGLYEADPEPSPLEDFEVDPTALLRQLVDRESHDDLAELRRMIKATNKNLNHYERQICESSHGVMEAADQFHREIDCRLRYQMTKLKMDKGTNSNPNPKKAFSVNKLKNTKFS